MSARRVYKVPGLFWDDHCARELDKEPGYRRELGVKGRVMEVELDDEGFVGLYSDAFHYADDPDGFDESLDWLIASAKRTVASLTKQAPELVERWHVARSELLAVRDRGAALRTWA